MWIRLVLTEIFNSYPFNLAGPINFDQYLGIIVVTSLLASLESVIDYEWKGLRKIVDDSKKYILAFFQN